MCERKSSLQRVIVNGNSKKTSHCSKVGEMILCSWSFLYELWWLHPRKFINLCISVNEDWPLLAIVVSRNVTEMSYQKP